MTLTVSKEGKEELKARSPKFTSISQSCRMCGVVWFTSVLENAKRYKYDRCAECASKVHAEMEAADKRRRAVERDESFSYRA